jgi:hypothetical protein
VAVDFSSVLYLQCQDQFARDVTITPIASAPGHGAYVIRGIFSTRPVEVQTELGMAVLPDRETILDIRDNEFFDGGLALPVQGDLINIPSEGAIPAEGDWEVTDAVNNGGGETTLTIRKYGAAMP